MTNGQPDDLEDWYAAEQDAERPSVTPTMTLAKLGLVMGLIPLGLTTYFLTHRNSAR